MPSGASMLLSRVIGKSKPSRPGFRSDIQGLRAFAVIAVILDHLFQWPSGGFVGVDIFFVISGFLITGHLMREWEDTEHISFLDFYKGRVKRILPAATLALVVTVAASFFLLNKSRAMSVLWDGVLASLFSANWRFASAGTDYFQADGPVSPLQHFWSLAVEEQFYFIWPLVMFLALVMVTRSKSEKIRPRVVAGFLMGALSAASFAWAMLETSAAPTMAYFSTFSRAWELGIGALLALAVPMLLKINDRIRPGLAWVGISAMVASVFVIDSSQAFPAPTALLPVLATALIIAAGTGGEQRFIAPLTNPVSGYIGNISYSLYLWHFPVIILLAEFMDEGRAYYIAALSLTLVLSVYAFYLVEDPIRRSTWLNGIKRSRMAPKRTGVPVAYQNLSLSFIALITAAALAYTFLPSASPTAAPVPAAAAEARPKPDEKTDPAPRVTAIQDSLQTALQATTWTKLNPTMDEVMTAPRAPADIDSCGHANQFELGACTFGDASAKKTAVILGDSISMTMANPIRLALGDKWKVIVHGMYGCPFSSVTASSDSPAILAACPGNNESGVDLVNSVKPDLVFVSNTYEPRQVAGTKADLTASEWSDTVEKQVEKLEIKTKNVVFLSAPPADKDPATCYNKLSSPADCVSAKTESWTASLRAETSIAADSRWSLVDTSDLFCVGSRCPSFAAGTPMKSDRGHITVPYGKLIAPALGDLLRERSLL